MKKIFKKIRGYILLTLGLMVGKPISFRYQLPDLLNFLRLGGCGAEIGVLRGRFSEIILNHSSLSLLCSIDPWQEFDKESYRDVSNVEQVKHEEKYQETVGKLKKFGNRSKIIRQTSENASKIIENNSLDFVYIDANHSYEGCKQDIELWWPKIKDGGVVSGDDYGEKFGVKKAVDEFVKESGQQLFLTFEAGASWYFVKNKKLTFSDKIRLYKYLLFS